MVVFEESRRQFLWSLLGGATAVSALSRLPGGGTVQAQEEFEETFRLIGQTSGWEGVEPESIAGVTNPTLEMAVENAPYRIIWENGDGQSHNVVIEDFHNSPQVESDFMSEEGAEQVVEFEAGPVLDDGRYYCANHESSMQGDLVVASGAPELSYSVTSPGETVTAGEPVQFSVEVSNTGTASGEVEVGANFGDASDSTVVSVASEDSETVQFSFETSDLGGESVSWSITADGDELESGTVSVEAPAAFTYTVEGPPATVEVGQPIEIVVSATNDGNTAGETEVGATVGSQTDSSILEVDAGATAEATFTFQTDGLGGETLQWSASGDGTELDSGSVEVSGGDPTPTPTPSPEPTPTPTPDDPTPTPTPTSSGGSDGSPGFGLLAGFAGLAGGAVAALRRYRQDEPEE